MQKSFQKDKKNHYTQIIMEKLLDMFSKENRKKTAEVLVYLAITLELFFMVLEKSEVSIPFISHVFRVTFLLTFAAVLLMELGVPRRSRQVQEESPSLQPSSTDSVGYKMEFRSVRQEFHLHAQHHNHIGALLL